MEIYLDSRGREHDAIQFDGTEESYGEIVDSLVPADIETQYYPSSCTMQVGIIPESPMSSLFQGAGKDDGDWLVRCPNGRLEVVLNDDFQRRFRIKK